MKKLTVKQVIKLHEILTERTGGSSGIRDLSALQSSLENPFQTFDSTELYSSIEEKAARKGFSIVCNHPFIDGNKRIGLLVMLTFLEYNGVTLSYTNEELIDLGLGLASGEISYEQLIDWINNHK